MSNLAFPRTTQGRTVWSQQPTRRKAMQYLLLIYENEADRMNATKADMETMFAEYREFTQSIIQSGHIKAGDALQPTRPRPRCASATARRCPPTARSPRRGAARRLLPGRGQGSRRGDRARGAHPRRADGSIEVRPDHGDADGLPQAVTARREAARAMLRSSGRWTQTRTHRNRVPRGARPHPRDADPPPRRLRARRGGAARRLGGGASRSGRARAARQPARLAHPAARNKAIDDLRRRARDELAGRAERPPRPTVRRRRRRGGDEPAGP